MWPARWAASCGRCAGANSLPENSSGERTSTRFCAPMAAIDLVPQRADGEVLFLCGVGGLDPVGDLGDQRAAVQLPLLAAAVDQLDVLVAVQLEVPVGVGGEPVVVAAVQHDGVVVGDALGRQQLLEAGPVDEVAADRVLQLGLPVDLHGAGDVPGVVGGGVLVDLDEDQARGGQVLLCPFGGDEGVLAAHAVLLAGMPCAWAATVPGRQDQANAWNDLRRRVSRRRSDRWVGGCGREGRVSSRMKSTRGHCNRARYRRERGRRRAGWSATGPCA